MPFSWFESINKQQSIMAMSKKYRMCNMHLDYKPHSLFQEKFKKPTRNTKGEISRTFLQHPKCEYDQGSIDTCMICISGQPIGRQQPHFNPVLCSLFARLCCTKGCLKTLSPCAWAGLEWNPTCNKLFSIITTKYFKFDKGKKALPMDE